VFWGTLSTVSARRAHQVHVCVRFAVQVSAGEMALVLEGISVHRATYHRHFQLPIGHQAWEKRWRRRKTL